MPTLTTYQTRIIPDWVDYKPDYANPKIGVNARLFNDFDLAAVPVEHVNGKNDW